jgi:thymidylate synthase ThyX
MKLIKQSSKILESTSSLKAIERAARLCYKSEDKITEDDSSAIQLVNNIVKRKHYAMIEFGNDIHIKIPSYIFEIYLIKTLILLPCFRFVRINYYDRSYELSFNPRTAIELIDEFSCPDITSAEAQFLFSIIKQLPTELIPSCISDQKYDYIKQLPIKYTFDNFEPRFDNQKTVVVKLITNRGVTHELVMHRLCSFAQKSSRYCDETGDIEFIEPVWYDRDEYPESTFEHILRQVEGCYNYLRKDNNWKPEQAREVLSNALKTEIMIKATIEEWKHIFSLRCDKAAHPQMIALMTDLRNQFIEQKLI